jgi:hypothetical protein
LRELHHFAGRLSVTLIRAGLTPALSLILVAGLGGCHKHMRPALPHGVLAPVDLETASVPDDVEIATLPPPELGPLPATPPPAKPTPRKRPTPAPKEDVQQTPAQVAAAAEPATLAIGALSTGGDATPQSQQQARDLIASIVKRIAALPARTADAQKTQIKQVKNFLDQAQQALNSGDAEGATNLATKARLLMDDLEKK